MKSIGVIDADGNVYPNPPEAGTVIYSGDQVAALQVSEQRLISVIGWLEKNQADVFRRGLWDAANGNREEHALMKFDPATGNPKPYPSHAAQWREYHGESAWLFNPWTGAKRSAGDVCSDLFGELILPDGQALISAGTCKDCGGTHPIYRSCSGPSEPPRPAGHHPKA